MWDQVAGSSIWIALIEINQSPIGRTPRSNPATYTKVFDLIRDLHHASGVKDSWIQQGAIFLQRQGRTMRRLQGAGLKTIEMQFLSDVQIPL